MMLYTGVETMLYTQRPGVPLRSAFCVHVLRKDIYGVLYIQHHCGCSQKLLNHVRLPCHKVCRRGRVSRNVPEPAHATIGIFHIYKLLRCGRTWIDFTSIAWIESP